MARQGKGILGGFSGSVANITGNIRKEGDVIKKKITTPNPSKSASQAATRSAMQFINLAYKVLPSVWFTKGVYPSTKLGTILNSFTSRSLRGIASAPHFSAGLVFFINAYPSPFDISWKGYTINKLVAELNIKYPLISSNPYTPCQVYAFMYDRVSGIFYPLSTTTIQMQTVLGFPVTSVPTYGTTVDFYIFYEDLYTTKAVSGWSHTVLNIPELV